MNIPKNMNQKQFEKLQNLMAVSTLEESEKNAWLYLIPIMAEEEIQELLQILSDEVVHLTDIYLDILKERI